MSLTFLRGSYVYLHGEFDYCVSCSFQGHFYLTQSTSNWRKRFHYPVVEKEAWAVSTSPMIMGEEVLT